MSYTSSKLLYDIRPSLYDLINRCQRHASWAQFPLLPGPAVAVPCVRLPRRTVVASFPMMGVAYLTEDHSMMTDPEFVRSMTSTCCLLAKVEERTEGRWKRAMVRIDPVHHEL